MMDEEIRQAVSEVREMKQMCGNINMKLTNIVTQRGQDWKKKLEAEYQRGLEEGKKAFDLLGAERDSEYQRGLSEGNDIGYKDGVKDGRNEAWETARKIVTWPDRSLINSDTFDLDPGESIFAKYSASEAIAKLKAYEEKQKADEDVKRGDVVRHKINGLTYIVTLANECGYVLLDSDGNFATSCITNSFEKTGKHVDIDKILEGLRYDG